MIKTRFAPSPTGYLHVGGLRTALYCYLFARKNKGKYILRIEDTDQERYVEGAEENLIKTLEWVGLHHDEGPFRQSERTEIYKEHAQKLIDSGHAYRCFCSKERLDEMRKVQMERKQATMYDRKCVDLPESEVKAKMEAGESFVIRQKMPYELIKFKDLVRGNVQFDGKTVDDSVLMKSDGFPTYHLANVVDDHLMEITHVIRGEEWLPSTPKHIALYNAFGWEIPEFAHLPLLLNPDKTKLSKRQGDVAVEDYIKKGYSKEAITNFVAFLGWNPGGGEEKEIFTLKELEEAFSLEKVHKAGAVFNIEKLDWFNWRWEKEKFQQETENMTPEQKAEKLLEKCEQYLQDDQKKDKEKLLKAVLTVEEKILKDPKDTAANIDFYFNLPNYDKELLTHEKMKVDFNQALLSLEKVQEDLQKLEDWTEESLKQTLLETVQTLGVKNGQVLWPLRSALTGVQFSPGVFESAWILGKEETLKRIETAINKLK
ncbi:MAG: glutamate--tRNA ligase [Nitrospirae bacterium]|nr:glutamate--tRNA ligase [Nitrospirota bacterium]